MQQVISTLSSSQKVRSFPADPVVEKLQVLISQIGTQLLSTSACDADHLYPILYNLPHLINPREFKTCIGQIAQESLSYRSIEKNLSDLKIQDTFKHLSEKQIHLKVLEALARSRDPLLQKLAVQRWLEEVWEDYAPTSLSQTHCRVLRLSPPLVECALLLLPELIPHHLADACLLLSYLVDTESISIKKSTRFFSTIVEKVQTESPHIDLNLLFQEIPELGELVANKLSDDLKYEHLFKGFVLLGESFKKPSQEVQALLLAKVQAAEEEKEKEKEKDFSSLVAETMDTFPSDQAPQLILDYLENQLIPLLENDQNKALEILIFLAGKRDFSTKKAITYFKALNLTTLKQDPRVALLIKLVACKPATDFSKEETCELIKRIDALIKMGKEEALKLIHLVKISGQKPIFLLQLAQIEVDPARSKILMEALSPLMQANISVLKEACEMAKKGKSTFRKSISQFILEFPLPVEKPQRRALRSLWMAWIKDPDSCVNCYEACQKSQTTNMLGLLFKGARENIEFYDYFVSKAIAQRPSGESFIPLFEARSALKESLELSLHQLKKVDLSLIKTCTKFPSKEALASAWNILRGHLNDVVNSASEFKTLEMEAKKFIAFCLADPQGFRLTIEQDVVNFISSLPVNGDLDFFKRIEEVLSFLIKNQLASRNIAIAFYEFLIKAFREIYKSTDKTDLLTCPIYLFLKYSQFFEKGLEKEFECFKITVLACLKWLNHFPEKEANCQHLIESLWMHARSRNTKPQASPLSGYSSRRPSRAAPKNSETDSNVPQEFALIQAITHSIHQGNPNKDFLFNLIYPLLMTFINSSEPPEIKLKLIENFIYSYPFNSYEGLYLPYNIGQMMSCLISEAIGQQVFKDHLYEMLELLMYLPQEFVKDISPARGTNFNRLIALSVLINRLSQANTQFSYLHCMTLLKEHQDIFHDCNLILLKNYHKFLNELAKFYQNMDKLDEEKKKNQKIFLRSVLQICIDQIHDVIRDLKIEKIDKENGKYFFEFLLSFAHLISEFKEKGLYENSDQSFLFIKNAIVSTLGSLENLFKDHRSFAAHCIPVYECLLATFVQFDPLPKNPEQYAKAITDLTLRAAKHAPFFQEVNAFSTLLREKELIDFIFQGQEDLKNTVIANLETIACPTLRAPRSSPIDSKAVDSLTRLITIPSKEELEKLYSLKKVVISSEDPEKRQAALRSILVFLKEKKRGVPDFYLELNAACKELKNEELQHELWAVIAQENMLQLAVNGTGGAVQIFIELLKRWSHPPDLANVSRFFLKKGYLNTIAQIFKDPLFKNQKAEFYALLLNIALSSSKAEWNTEEKQEGHMKLVGSIVYECVRKLTEEKHSFDSSLKEILPFCFRYFHYFFSAKVQHPQLSWQIFYLMNFAFTHDPVSIESLSPDSMNKVVENIHNQIKKLLVSRFTNFTRQTIGSGFALYTALQKKYGAHIDFRFLSDMNDLTLSVLIQERELKKHENPKENDKSVKKEPDLFLTISRQVSSFIYPHLTGEGITETVRQTFTRVLESYLITMRKYPETFTDLFQSFYILISKLCEKKALLNDDKVLCFNNLIMVLAQADSLTKSQVELIKELIKKESEFFLKYPKLSWQLMMILKPHTLQEASYSKLKLCKLPGYLDSIMELLEEMCTLKNAKACGRIGPLLTFVNFRVFNEDWERLGSFYEKWIEFCLDESLEDKQTPLFKAVFTSLMSPMSDSKTPLIEYLEENHSEIIRQIMFNLINAVADCYDSQNGDAQPLINDAMNVFRHTVKRKYVNKNSNLAEYYNLLLKIIKMLKTAQPTSSYHSFIELGKLFCQLARVKLKENERVIFAKAIVKYTDLFENYTQFSDFDIPPFFDRENIVGKGIFEGLREMQEKFESNIMQAIGN